MTQLAISEELATTIEATASSRGCTTQELLESIFYGYESDFDYAERLLTPEAQARMIDGARRAKLGEFTTEEEVDRKFEAFFQDPSPGEPLHPHDGGFIMRTRLE